MKRRTFAQMVAGGVVASAGCLSRLESGYGGGETAEETPSMNVSISEPADAAMVGIDAELVEQSTEEHPASLRVRLTNEAESQRTFRFGSSPPLSTYVSSRGDDGGKLVLVPDDTSNVSIQDSNEDGTFQVVPDQPTDGCWQAVDDVIGQDILQSRTLEPGGSVSGTYTVLTGPDGDSCVPAGEYRFEGRFEVGNEEFEWSLVASTTDKK